MCYTELVIPSDPCSIPHDEYEIRESKGQLSLQPEIIAQMLDITLDVSCK
jgi:hypothetical protein